MRTQRTDMLTASTPVHTGIKEIIRGERRYELTNHLGNVLVVCSDQLTVTDTDSNNLVDFYAAEVVSYSDYYPFGAEMAGRSSTGDYRYNFQNQEKDDEFWGGAISFKYRIEDARLGRFFSVDPLFKSYVANTPYAFSENRVVDGIELEGTEYIRYDAVMFSMDGDGYLDIKIGQFSEAWQDAWHSKQRELKRKGAIHTTSDGTQYLGGMPTRMGAVTTNLDSPSSPAIPDRFEDEEVKSLGENGGIRRKDGGLDRRFTYNKMLNKRAKGGLVLEVGILVLSFVEGVNSYYADDAIKADKAKLADQITAMSQATQAINKYTSENSIDPSLMTQVNARRLFWFVLTGEMMDSQDENTLALYRIGTEILNNYNVNTGDHVFTNKYSFIIPSEINSKWYDNSAITPTDPSNSEIKK